MSLYDFHEDPQATDPTLVVSLEGWIDAGGAAAMAAETILAAVPHTTKVATFDTDNLLDHRARRPVMHVVDGVNTGLTWPSIELLSTWDAEERDVLFLVGPEPDHNWPSFARSVLDLAESLEVVQVLGLGAYPAPVPHTRPVQLAGTASTAELARRVGFIRGTLDVPAGIQAAIEREAADRGLPALGIWAQVPHYAAGMSYPAAAARLVEGLEEAADLRFDSGDLDRQAKATEARLEALLADSDEHRELVHQLEIHVDQEAEAHGDADGEIELRSGDELAAEFEKFLREQGD
ncbi:MAG TPA: PAC2 family protein [Acidimicrobiales bacterium]|nr:PAC2 family protein [Acidimicrobiales bacterium]